VGGGGGIEGRVLGREGVANKRGVALLGFFFFSFCLGGVGLAERFSLRSMAALHGGESKNHQGARGGRGAVGGEKGFLRPT